MFTALLGCFTATATLPENFLFEKNRKRLLISQLFLDLFT